MFMIAFISEVNKKKVINENSEKTFPQKIPINTKVGRHKNLVFVVFQVIRHVLTKIRKYALIFSYLDIIKLLL